MVQSQEKRSGSFEGVTAESYGCIRQLFRLIPKLVILGCAAALVVRGAPGFAQASGFATVNGTVADKSGAMVAGAKVTVLNVDTGATRETVTGNSSEFAATDLPVGHYSVTVLHSV